ncbi:MAG TPA: type IV toxin-antitoxin system AbiEi family antitoxin domain-containing protein [Burkholderiales bacterium]|nr:type IV toxin-antitoxin system AbiEi family antitoxin domain-containing protein [Burkholderiales bacterium]
MATTTQSKLKTVYTRLPAGSPITSAQLAEMGISADLAVHYARSGWLKRLARGVYCRPGESLSLHPSLVVLERQIEGLHVGGKTALEWYGLRQYVSQNPVLHLYGWMTARLPDWFVRHFPAEYHRKRLFDETAKKLLNVGRFEDREGAPRVSSPERAFLELLDEVGVRQPLEEAREIAEGAYSLRAEVLVDLLKRCTSVKTVRLCLALGRELSLPWAGELDAAALPKGSARPWISKSKNGLLVLKA